MRLNSRSFAGGEITPELYGRLDLTKFQTGLATCRNLVCLPHGPAARRPGFEYVLQANGACRLIPFSYNTEQTYVVEVGDGYMRFHANGGTVLDTEQSVVSVSLANPGSFEVTGHGWSVGDWVFAAAFAGMVEVYGYYKVGTVPNGNHVTLTDMAGNAIDTSGFTAYTGSGTLARVHEIATSYAEADLFDINFVQSADVMTLVHPSYAPAELRRTAANVFALTTISFVPTISQPTGPTVVVGAGSGTDKYQYMVTAIAEGSLEESVASDLALGSTTKTITGITQANPGVITTSAVHGLAVEDPIYISSVVGMTELNGSYYWVNSVPSTTTLTLKDADGTVIDTSGFTAYSSAGTITYAFIENDLTGTGAFNTVAWSAVTGAVRYNVYKYSNGLFGYIGQTAGLSFNDDYITADVSFTPSIANNPFASDYPGVASYFEQRRLFAQTDTYPQNYWMTKSGTESNLGYSIPTRDDDSIFGRLVARQVNEIRHFVPLSELLVLTSGGVWRMSSSSGALTPYTLEVKPQSYVGASKVVPQVTGGSVLYVQARGARVQELTYAWESAAYRSLDISIMAPHLFDGYTLIDCAYARAPEHIFWAVRSDGTLLGMTYVPEHEVAAWHHHDTDGTFESVAAVSESEYDALYAVVKRSVNGSDVRYIERLHNRAFTDLEDWFGVDAGLSYSGEATTTITGLRHLEGKTVSILADGAVVPNQVVSNGAITLTTAASAVHVGLAYTSDLKTLPIGVSAELQGRKKNVSKVYLQVNKSSGIQFGPDENRLRTYPQRTTEPYGSPPNMVSAEIEMDISPAWTDGGQVFVRQQEPLPLTIAALTLEVEVGG